MFGTNSDDTKSTGAAEPQPAVAPALPFNNVPDMPAPQPAAPVPEPTATTPATDYSLMEIKQQALHHLQPLVDHLDQTPEEKFKTTMMLIQATDNANLVKEAYAAANQITDEKARAQALLDVVNEINYFTHKSEK